MQYLYNSTQQRYSTVQNYQGPWQYRCRRWRFKLTDWLTAWFHCHIRRTNLLATLIQIQVWRFVYWLYISLLWSVSISDRVSMQRWRSEHSKSWTPANTAGISPSSTKPATVWGDWGVWSLTTMRSPARQSMSNLLLTCCDYLSLIIVNVNILFSDTCKCT